MKEKNYCRVQSFLSEVPFNHLFAQAVVDKKVDGKIFVDNLKVPSTVYIKHNYGMSLLCGSFQNESFNGALCRYLLNYENDRLQDEWMQVYPPQWSGKLRDLIGDSIIKYEANCISDINIIEEARVNFIFNPEKYKPFKIKNTREISIEKTNATLFDKIDGAVVPHYFWRNAQEFEKDAIGFSAIYKETPVSTVFSAFASANTLEIGIETESAFRGFGIAKAVCSAFINYCLKKSLEPLWSCRQANVESYKLAKSLGFEPTLTMPYYRLPVNVR